MCPKILFTEARQPHAQSTIPCIGAVVGGRQTWSQPVDLPRMNDVLALVVDQRIIRVFLRGGKRAEAIVTKVVLLQQKVEQTNSATKFYHRPATLGN